MLPFVKEIENISTASCYTYSSIYEYEVVEEINKHIDNFDYVFCSVHCKNRYYKSNHKVICRLDEEVLNKLKDKYA